MAQGVVEVALFEHLDHSHHVPRLLSCNAVGKPREWWGLVHVVQGPAIYEAAKQMEEIGFDGVTALQIYAPPFVPLAVAAAATRRMRIATGIAVAATRSPLETAMLAMDLDRVSEGRFILGLGTGVLSVNMGAYGLPPAAHPRAIGRAGRLGELPPTCTVVSCSPATT